MDMSHTKERVYFNWNDVASKKSIATDKQTDVDTLNHLLKKYEIHTDHELNHLHEAYVDSEGNIMIRHLC